MRIRNLEALAGGGAHDPAAPACADAGVATLDRRSFLKLTALAGGGFALGVAPMLAG
ncbi:twin-arginine translocation signal domain-containing protein, partial [Ralstonia pseudosolanacearum]